MMSCSVNYKEDVGNLYTFAADTQLPVLLPVLLPAFLLPALLLVVLPVSCDIDRAMMVVALICLIWLTDRHAVCQPEMQQIRQG